LYELADSATDATYGDVVPLPEDDEVTVTVTEPEALDE